MPVIVAPCLLLATAERAFARRGDAAALDLVARGGENGPLGPWVIMSRKCHAVVLGYEVPVATTFPARLLGLAHRDRDEAGPGLLIPRCSSVHTFGMRFALDLVFLDGEGRPISLRREIPPRRLAWDRRASAVLELPAP